MPTAAKKKPIFTSAQRRKKIRDLINGGAGLVEKRGGEINLQTGFVLKSNADLLAESYGQVADEYDWFANYVDQLLTGGVWGQFIVSHLIVGIQIGVIRGWVDVESMPEPLRVMFGGPIPAPSEEVREHEAQAERTAPTNGAPPKSPKGAPAPRPPRPAPPRPESN